MKNAVSILFALLMPIPAFAQGTAVTVFAAASLRGPLDAVAAGYGSAVAVSYGGSGTMARQIMAGAPADVTILASPVWMDWLADRRLIDPDTRRDLLSNTLVLIAPKDEAALAPDPSLAPLPDIAGLLGNGRLAMGQRDAVPAGIYAREWLTHIGQWDALASRLAETDNVRAALALVARGDTPLGVVYRTDALAEPAVRVIYAVPDDQHSPITYPAAALTDRGTAFLSYLQSPESLAIFMAAGFSPTITTSVTPTAQPALK